MQHERRRRRAATRIPAILAVLLLLVGMVPASAAGETETTKRIEAGDVQDGDLFTGALYVEMAGTLKGDLIAAGQSLDVGGQVDGDILGFANDIKVGGTVNGNIRAGSNTVTVSGLVERNLMLYGSSIVLTDAAAVGGSAYLIGGTVQTEGDIAGDLMIGADSVVLGGTIDGDVSINSNMGDVYASPVTSLTFKPGTVIKGTLTVRAEQEPLIPSDVTIGKLNFTPYSKQNAATQESGINGFVRSILTAVIYFLFGLVLFRIFPRFFARPAVYLHDRMLQTAGIGVAALGSIVAGTIVLIILIVLSVMMLSGSVVGFAITVFTAFVVVTSALSTMPVALWLGGYLLGRHKSVPAALAAGLAIITLLRVLLSFATTMDGIGGFAGFAYWLMNLAIWFLGMGAVLRTFSDFIKAANRDAEFEENRMSVPPMQGPPMSQPPMNPM